MCVSATTAALLAAGSTALSTGAAVYSGQQQQAAMDDYNQQAAARNRRISEQYADRQEKIRSAETTQDQIFQQIADRQDTEKARQEEFARQGRQSLNETLENLAGGTDQRLARVEESANERRSIADQAGDYGVTASYSGSGSAAPEVVRNVVEGRASAGQKEGREITDAGFRLQGFGDLGTGDQQLFRMLDTSLMETRNKARRSAAGAENEMMPLRGMNNALNRSQRFYGGQGYGIPEPVYQAPNTTAADAVQGVGQAVTGIAAPHIFKSQPGGSPTPGSQGYLRGRTRGSVPPSDGLRG